MATKKVTKEFLHGIIKPHLTQYLRFKDGGRWWEVKWNVEQFSVEADEADLVECIEVRTKKGTATQFVVVDE